MTSHVIRGRAMLVHTAALGDFVLSLRIVAALRSAGASEVTLLGRPLFAELGRCAGVDGVIDFETGGCHALFQESAALPTDSATRLAGHNLTVNCAAAGHAVFNRRLAHATSGRVIDIDPRPRADWTGHITDQWLRDLKRAGFSTMGAGPPWIDLPLQLVEQSRSDLDPGGEQKTIIIHPGSGGRAKCWPLDRFIALAGGLAARGDSVSFIVGPVEVERWPESDHARLAAVGRVLRRDRLLDLAALLAAADHYVGNDSGVTHLAAAVGTDVTAVFGPTDPRLWRPLGRNVAVVGGGDWPEVDWVWAAVQGRLDVTTPGG